MDPLRNFTSAGLYELSQAVTLAPTRQCSAADLNPMVAPVADAPTACKRPATKRPAAAALVAEENKRFRLALERVADEWRCSITHELPLHPVMAEDSRVYERRAIEVWLRRHEAVVRSPMTSTPL
jgi:hypothetical protein